MQRFIIATSLIAVIAVLCGAGFCHSEEFWLAQRKLNKMVLTPAQKAEIVMAERDFQKKWDKTHAEKGCSHHEAHAAEFVAAASGVLTPTQFKEFRKRDRNPVEVVGYEIRLTGQHIDDLIAMAEAL